MPNRESPGSAELQDEDCKSQQISTKGQALDVDTTAPGDAIFEFEIKKVAFDRRTSRQNKVILPIQPVGGKGGKRE